MCSLQAVAAAADDDDAWEIYLYERMFRCVIGDSSIDDGFFEIRHVLELFVAILYDNWSDVIGS